MLRQSMNDWFLGGCDGESRTDQCFSLLKRNSPENLQTGTTILMSHSFSTGELRALWGSVPLAFKHPVLQLRNHILQSGVGTTRL